MKSGNKLFGQRIRELRNEHDLTQENLAEMIGVEYQTINRMENGVYFTNYNTLEKMAKIFNVPVQELFNFGHVKQKTQLIIEINQFLINSDREETELVYKIVRGISQYKQSK